MPSHLVAALMLLMGLIAGAATSATSAHAQSSKAGGAGGVEMPTVEKPTLAFVPYGPMVLNQAVWPNGEVLRYEIRWGIILAAEGTFVARDAGTEWLSELFMRTRAAGETIYPVRGRFSSKIQKSPWRSVEYRQDRKEPKRTLIEENRVDYVTKNVTRDRISRKSVDNFTFTQDGMEDIGSMLYSLRTGEWKVGTKRDLAVYEDGKVKLGEAICTKRLWMRVGNHPPSWIIMLDCRPTIPAQKGGLLVWMTDSPERLPLRAELKFRYGTFTMDLVGKDNVAVNPKSDPATQKEYVLVLPEGVKAGPGY